MVTCQVGKPGYRLNGSLPVGVSSRTANSATARRSGRVANPLDAAGGSY